MSWNEIFQIISGVVLSVGGAGAIMWKISSYLGEMWAKKHLESIKKEYQKEVETYKNQLDMIKTRALRYSGQQFKLYNKLWKILYELKTAADMLWEEANNQNLRAYSQELKKTLNEVEESYLFIEEGHYQELKKLLQEFSEYKFGKIKLIQLYQKELEISRKEIQLCIRSNRQKKKNYEELISKIRKNLKQQIGGA